MSRTSRTCHHRSSGPRHGRRTRKRLRFPQYNLSRSPRNNAACMAPPTPIPARRELAWTQLRVRRDALWGSGALHLRASPGGFTYRGWSRGVAWYLLGLVRCLAEVPPAQRPPDLVQEVGRAPTWAASHQRSDGLWANFLEEPELDADTSGSAGIAAMFARLLLRGFPVVTASAPSAAGWPWPSASMPLATRSGWPRTIKRKAGKTCNASQDGRAPPLAWGWSLNSQPSLS